MPTNPQLELINRDWLDEAVPIVRAALPGLGEFSSDSLHGLLPAPPHDNYFGILVRKLKAAGLIRFVRYQKSTRPERNSGVVGVWAAV